MRAGPTPEPDIGNNGEWPSWCGTGRDADRRHEAEPDPDSLGEERCRFCHASRGRSRSPTANAGAKAGDLLMDVARGLLTPEPAPQVPDSPGPNVMTPPTLNTPTGPGWAEVWLEANWRDVWVSEGDPDETGGRGLYWLNTKTDETDGVDGHFWRNDGPELRIKCEGLEVRASDDVTISRKAGPVRRP